jgi:hypothetical protein
MPRVDVLPDEPGLEARLDALLPDALLPDDGPEVSLPKLGESLPPQANTITEAATSAAPAGTTFRFMFKLLLRRSRSDAAC